MTSIYDQGLGKTPANFVALSPVSFLERSAEIYPDMSAVIHGERRYTWAQVRERSARLAACIGSLIGNSMGILLRVRSRRACNRIGFARCRRWG